MENLIRFLMRFILVPLGYCAASIAATSVVLIGWWQVAQPTVSARPEYEVAELVGLVIAAPVLFMLMFASFLLPASIGILISEAFAIRAWIFHVLNGIVSVWSGWQLFGNDNGSGVPLDQPLVVIAAGIAGGFAYWAVAGFSAGFYKPIFRRDPPPTVPATTP
ncbi:MAG: hypothetical protein K2Y71_06820 [Xanthobacteraceae bacterium]|nr:hypothetical protein [Xanthobacteraceae bacterium]